MARMALLVALLVAAGGCGKPAQPVAKDVSAGGAAPGELAVETPLTELEPTAAATSARTETPAEPAPVARPGVGRTPRTPRTDTGAGTTVSAAPPDEPPAAPGRKTYVVVKGDTLWSIARKVYGDPRRHADIAQTNQIADPTKLRIGQVLIIP